MNILSISNFIETDDALTARVIYQTKNIFGSITRHERTLFIKRFGEIYYAPMWTDNLKSVNDSLKELVLHGYKVNKRNKTVTL